VFTLVLPGLAATRRVEQTRETRLRKAAPPLNDRSRTRVQSLRHRLVAEPLGNGQDHFRPKSHAPLSLFPRPANLSRSPAARPSKPLPPLS
jgi:hypothetical protein